MPDIKIYHNPRCSKSRQTLEIINNRGINVHIIEYLKDPPTKEELYTILEKLNKTPHEIIRTKEDVYKEKIAGRNLEDEELITIMTENPILIERPIVVTSLAAVIGRPPENVLSLFS